jgi:tetratricopeptide (TPR) repeat protein
MKTYSVGWLTIQKYKLTALAKNRRFLLLVVLILAASGGILVWYFRNRERPSPPVVSKLINDASVSGLRDHQNHDQAIAQLIEADKKATSKYDHYLINIRIGIIASEKGDAKLALEYYQKAEKYAEANNIDVIIGIARSAEEAGDSQLAIKYYQKALDIYRPQLPNRPVLQTIIQDYEARLKRLEGR